MPDLVTCLWFDNDVDEALALYKSVFDDFRPGKVTHYSEVGQEIHGRAAGSVQSVEFELLGHKFMALNGGPLFKFTEAVSFQIMCETQDEVDYYWERLIDTSKGDGQCGWLKDKFGVSWQVVPRVLSELLGDQDTEQSKRAMAAMLQMNKLDINELKRAYGAS